MGPAYSRQHLWGKSCLCLYAYLPISRSIFPLSGKPPVLDGIGPLVQVNGGADVDGQPVEEIPGMNPMFFAGLYHQVLLAWPIAFSRGH